MEVFGVRGAKSGARAGIVEHAAEYEWSSAAAHLSNKDRSGLLDMQWWQHNAPSNWADMLRINDSAADLALRTCTYAGRPFGEENFVTEMAARFGRYSSPGRPSKKAMAKKSRAGKSAEQEETQSELF